LFGSFSLNDAERVIDAVFSFFSRVVVYQASENGTVL